MRDISTSSNLKNDISTFIDELKNDIAKNLLLDVINSVLAIIDFNRKSRIDEAIRQIEGTIINISRNFHQLKKDYHNSIKRDEEYSLRLNQISSSLQYLLDEINALDPPLKLCPEKKKSEQINEGQREPEIFAVVVKLSEDFEKYTNFQALKFCNTIANLLKSEGSVKLESVKSGCVKLELTLNQEQFEELKKLYSEGKLNHLNVLGLWQIHIEEDDSTLTPKNDSGSFLGPEFVIHKILLDEHFVSFFQGLPDPFQQAILYSLDWVKSGDFPSYLINNPLDKTNIISFQIPAQPSNIIILGHLLTEHSILYISHGFIDSIKESDKTPFYEEAEFLFEDFTRTHIKKRQIVESPKSLADLKIL